MCSAVRSVWPCVRLFQVFGHVFGCLASLAVWSAIRSVWPWVRLLEVFGRVFGCYKFLAVCSAVSSVWPCVRPFSSVWPCLLRVFGRVYGCNNFWAVCSTVASVGRAFGRFKYWSVWFFYFLHVCICTLFYLFRALPIHFIVVVSAFCSMQCGLVPHHLSLIRFSEFCTVIFSFFAYYRHADFS